MVIEIVPTCHGPHVWYSARMWCWHGFYLDFMRVREWRRPEAPNVLAGPNEYYFERVCDQ